ncbi:MAG: DUF4160 domain-containing protein [Bacteroides sp.]|nr:DUF4160 domain-containing protein [Bacteroides sp.]
MFFLFYLAGYKIITYLCYANIIQQEGEAIFIIDQEVTLKDNKGMKPKDVSLAVSILEENKELISEEWNRLHES